MSRIRQLGLILLCAASACFAGSRCPDPRLREATIGRDTIDAAVDLHHKPRLGAQVRLYASSGKVAWAGVTDKKGRFIVKNLPADNYRLEVTGWGSTTIRMVSTSMDQRSHYYVQLIDGCEIDSQVVN